MSVLHRLASSFGRRDEIPNRELARDLAAKKDRKGIREIAENLWNKNKNIQADLSGSGLARVKKVIKQAGAL